MMQQRDLDVINFIDKFKAASTSTIKELFFKKTSTRVAHRRLKLLVDLKELKRIRYYVSQEYVYYITKPPQLRHKLLLTDFYREANKLVDIEFFNPEIPIADVRPDAVMAYKLKGSYYIAFVEIEISNKGFDLAKYENLYLSAAYKTYFPAFPILIAVTNQNIPASKNLKVIHISEDLSNINSILQ